MKILKILLILLLIAVGEGPLSNCYAVKPVINRNFVLSKGDSTEASKFDFWVGEWDLSWSDTLKGSNSIKKEMNAKVIHENFNDPNTGFYGQSWSVYNPKMKVWQQTWVDNQGGYIVLNGNYENNKMILSTEEKTLASGKKVINRMIFYNITKESFDWNWENSEDGGLNWKLNWKIHYKRKK
jgi:hypothetical protein